MAKTGFWNDLFKAGRKQKHRVKLEDSSYTDLTDTQAYRFEELSHPQPGGAVPGAGGYPLEDAARRLGVDPGRLLEQAAQGSVHLYVAATGLTGRWQRSPTGRDPSQSQPQTLDAGFLALGAAACDELCRLGSTDVSILERRDRNDAPAGSRESAAVYFRLEEPCWVYPRNIVLLPPLPGNR